jgi:hypothetical protein
METKIRVYGKKNFTEDSIKELLDEFSKNKLNSLLKITFYDKDSLRYVGITDVNSKEEYIGYQATKRYLARNPNVTYFYEFLNTLLDQFIAYKTDGYIKNVGVKKVIRFDSEPIELGFREYMRLRYKNFNPNVDVERVSEIHADYARNLSFSRNYPELFESLL